MKPGDLVKFRSRTAELGPLGIVLAVEPANKVFENRSADIEWSCEYTPRGNYRFALLEVVSEAR